MLEVTLPPARVVRWKTPRTRILEPSEPVSVSWKVAVEVMAANAAMLKALLVEATT